MPLLKELKGLNGVILIHDEFIEISRKSLGGFIFQGSVGNRRFYYTSISAIEYKSPSMVSNGYFKIISSGTSEVNAKVGIFGSSIDSSKDPNTVILRAFTKHASAECDSLYAFAVNHLDSIKKQSPSQLSTQILPSNTSYLEELKALGELLKSNVLTQDEFEAEKQKILSKK